MINGFVQLRQFRQGDFDALCQLSKSESHGVFYPTLTVEKNGNLGGWVSINGVPFVFGHLTDKVLSPRDSFNVINNVENIVGAGGAQGIVWPIPEKSPFHWLMPRLGYESLGDYTMFHKSL